MEKREVKLTPHDGIEPRDAFLRLADALDVAVDAAGIQGLSLAPSYKGDTVAEVADGTLGYRTFATGESEPRLTGLTVSACEIEGKSIARRLLTPGYCLTWVGPGPNDPQDGDDSVEVGEYYRIADVADEIVREIVNFRLTARREA